MDFSKLRLEFKDAVLIVSFVVSFLIAYHSGFRDIDVRVTRIEAKQEEYSNTINRIEKRQEEFLSDQKEIQRDIKTILQRVGAR